MDAATLRDASFAVNHPRYPPLLPLVIVATQEVFGFGADDRLIRPLYAAFFPAFIVVLAHGIKRRSGSLTAAVTVLLVMTLPQLSFDSGGGAASTYSDLPLACFFGAGLLLLIRPDVSTGESWLAGVLLAGAVLTKTEGSALAPIALLCAGLRAWLQVRRPGFRTLVRATLPAASSISIAMLLLVSWRSGISDRLNVDYSSTLRWSHLARGIERIPEVVGAMTAAMRAPAGWGGFWFVFPALLLVGWRGVTRRESLPWLLAGVLAIAIPVLAYLITPEDAIWLVNTTWSRFLVQLGVPIFVLAASALEALLPTGAAFRRRFTRGGAVLSVILLAFIAFRLFAMNGPARAGRNLNMARCPQGASGATRLDERLAASIDVPSEDETIAGDLLVSGWAQENTGPSEITEMLIDGIRRPCSRFNRGARPDVAAALPRLGNCDFAGYEALIAFRAGDSGRHEIRVQFQAPDGRIRWLRRSFTWSSPTH